MSSIPWRVGFEIELLLPPGLSRADMAEALATQCRGRARRCFHLQSEPSAVPGMEVFHNLTLGYVVEDEACQWQAKCLDDLTLQADLFKAAAPREGWYRIVSDDLRILRLIQQQSNPENDMREVLGPIAGLFGTQLVPGPQGMQKVCDRAGVSVAMVCPLPGERERPCELVTAPWADEQEARLEAVLEVARGLGCLLPVEGATHIHFEGAALRKPSTLANLVNLLQAFGPLLKTLWRTNDRCTRLGSWPGQLTALVNSPGFREGDWPQARQELAGLGLTKYCDFNLVNLLRDDSFCTVELRVLPSSLQAEPIIRAGRMFAALLERAQSDTPFAPPADAPDQDDLLKLLALRGDDMDHWKSRVATA